LLWTAAAENPAAEEARLAAGSTVYADIKKQFDNSRDTISRSGEFGGDIPYIYLPHPWLFF
jgi:hypothetical protein